MTRTPSAISTDDLRWFKSSHSSNESADCIEVAAAEATIHVRDSKDPHGPRLAFSAAAWTSFVAFAASAAVR